MKQVEKFPKTKTLKPSQKVLKFLDKVADDVANMPDWKQGALEYSDLACTANTRPEGQSI